MKYRKNPVIIEAFQFDGDLQDRAGTFYVPEWAEKAYKDGTMYFTSPSLELYIDTLEGTHHASVGDYIIRGVNGEIYPCKPDIFQKTYEMEE